MFPGPPPAGVAVSRGSPFAVPLGRMSPQLVPHMAGAAQGRHSPTPTGYILPKPPAVSMASAAAVQAASAQPHVAIPGVIPYAQAPYAVYPPPPPPAGYPAYAPYPRPPFALPPGAPYPHGAEKAGSRAGVKAGGKEKQLWATHPAGIAVHPTIPVPVSGTRVAANFQVQRF